MSQSLIKPIEMTSIRHVCDDINMEELKNKINIDVFDYKSLFRYVTVKSQKIDDVKDKIVSLSKKLFASRFEKENLILTYGSRTPIHSCFLMLRHLKIGCINPEYESYIKISKIMGLDMVVIADVLNGDDLYEKLENADIDAFFFSNPNNPSNIFFDNERIVDICHRKNIWLLVDEVCISNLVSDNFDKSIGKYVKDIENSKVVVTNSLSKSYGFLGLHMGWCFTSKKYVNVITKCDAVTVGGPTAITYEMFENFLDDKLWTQYMIEFVKHTFIKQNYLTKELEPFGFKVNHRLDITGSIFFNISSLPHPLNNPLVLAEALACRGLLICDGSGYFWSGENHPYVRITCTVTEKEVVRAVEIIKEVVLAANAFSQ